LLNITIGQQIRADWRNELYYGKQETIGICFPLVYEEG